MKKVVLTHIKNDTIERIDDGKTVIYNRMSYNDLADYYKNLFSTFVNNTIMWIKDLRLYSEDMIRILYELGYSDVTEENPKIKDMKAKTFKYTIALKGNTYYIIIKRSKFSLSIYNIDNLLANIDDEEILKAWGSDTLKDDFIRLSDATYKGIDAMGGFSSKHTPFTVSMVALREWKKIEGLYFCDNLINCNDFKAPGEEFNNLSDYIRKSYCAGWNYCSERDYLSYKNVSGKVYDVNSEYPFIMATKPIPWGEPNYFYGEIPEEIKDNDNYYYFVRSKLKFKLKEGKHFPYIKKRGDVLYMTGEYLKDSNIHYIGRDGREHTTEYIIDLNGNKKKVFPEFVLTKTDYELIKRHYDIIEEEVIDGVYFKTARRVFSHFVNKFYNDKLEARKQGITGKCYISKTILNALSGALAKRDKRENVLYEYKYNSLSPKVKVSDIAPVCHIHMASAILSYAREYIYEKACENYDNFLYSDTDSLHLLGSSPVGLDIDSDRIGAFKIEHEFDSACYFKRKAYILHVTDEEAPRYDITMAGMSYNCNKLVTDLLNDNASRDPYLYAFDMLAKIYKGEYKDMYSFLDTNYWYTNESTGIEIVKRSKDFYKLIELINDTHNLNDKCRALLSIEYPSTISYSMDFKILDEVIWMKMGERTVG